jgi:hypothetical protein
MTRSLFSVWQLWVSWNGAPSLARGRVCNLLVQLLLGLARAATLRSKFSRTHDYILLSHLRLSQPGGPGSRIYISLEQGGPVIPSGTEFHFRLLLRLYSNSPSHRSSYCFRLLGKLRAYEVFVLLYDEGGPMLKVHVFVTHGLHSMSLAYIGTSGGEVVTIVSFSVTCLSFTSKHSSRWDWKLFQVWDLCGGQNFASGRNESRARFITG